MNDKAYRSYIIIMFALQAIGLLVCVVVWVRDGEPNIVFNSIYVFGCGFFGITIILRTRRKVAEIRRATQEEAEEPKDDETPN